MSSSRIVVTGIGATPPIGGTAPDSWSALLAGESGAALRAGGYHAQDTPQESSVALFHLNGAREPIRYQDGRFHWGEESRSVDELLDVITTPTDGRIGLRLVDVVGLDAALLVDLGDFLVVRVDWTPANALVYEVENRAQSWIDVHVGGTLVLHETSDAWINSEDQATPTWLRDGSFLWQSARTGFTHIYHYGASGTLIDVTRQLSR